jgi:hypothetical protein
VLNGSVLNDGAGVMGFAVTSETAPQPSANCGSFGCGSREEAARASAQEATSYIIQTLALDSQMSALGSELPSLDRLAGSAGQWICFSMSCS